MRTLSLVALLLFTVPLTFAQKSAGKPSDEGVAGTWDYTVRPDDPVAQGTFMLERHNDEWRGAIQTNAEQKFDTIEVDGDQLRFTFVQPNMGVITIWGAFDGDTFEGQAQPEGQDALPFAATRHDATADPTDPDTDSDD